MPSKLPNEILIRIFQQLHPIDQLECTLVCRRWNKLLEDYVLYHTIFIFSAASLKKLLQKIQQRSDIAIKIQRVAIHMNDMTPEGAKEAGIISKKLLSLTPNLKILHRNTPTILENKTQYPWYNTIEYISEDAGDETIDYFLSSNTCPNLKTFRYFCVREYHPLLKNASGLTSLILEEVSMGFNDLEGIHKHLPHLKSLQFRQLSYDGGAIFSGKEIAPATSITEFVAHVDNDEIDGVESYPELHTELLVYISRKYPNLSTLEYRYCGNNDLGPSETDEIIKMGWNPLLQRLGPQLKKVSIYLSSEEEQHIEAFDKFGCQINYLDLDCKYRQGIAKMAQSKQTFYIQTLVLCIESPSLDWLKSFRVLKKLKLFYGHCFCPKLQLSDILNNSPPTLESLYLRASAFDIDPSYTGTSNIKTLTFQSMKFDDKVDGFISRCFPQLSVLELRKCELQNKTLNLEKTALASFCYYNGTRDYPHCNDVILVTTLKDNKRRSYVLHDKQHGLEEVFYPQNYRPFKSHPASDVNDPKSALNFICNSVRNVAFTTSSDPFFITYE